MSLVVLASTVDFFMSFEELLQVEVSKIRSAGKTSRLEKEALLSLCVNHGI
jgi:hypothetical protein